MKTWHVVPSSKLGGVAFGILLLRANSGFQSSRLRRACIAFFTVAVSVTVLSLSTLLSYAEQGPFAGFSGSWSGGGNITLSTGSRETIRCRATYSHASANNLNLALRCASDSYNVDFRGNAISSGGNLTGNWFEATNHAAGQFIGSVKGNHIDARIEGQTFAAFLSMTTHGNRQSISLRSPGSSVSNVAIALTRR